MTPTIRSARTEDRGEVVETIVRAFARDPLLRFLAPGDEAYARVATAYFGCLFDLRAGVGGEVRVSDDLKAASLWNPPGGNRLGAQKVRAAFEAQVHPLLSAEEGLRFGEVERVLGAMHPDEPHWYLGIAAVHPEHQGRGLGGAVIRSLLAERIAADAPAFLITTAPGNVPIYERLGFATCIESDLAAGPHVWGMRREPG